MITTQEFDKLLNLTMLNLTDEEYAMYMSQMDQILGFMEKLNKLDISQATSYQLGLQSSEPSATSKISLERDYKTNTIGLSNVQHPVTGNMIQIKFKRG